MKRLWIEGMVLAAVLAVAGLGYGIVAAQTDGTPTDAPEATATVPAEDDGLSPPSDATDEGEDATATPSTGDGEDETPDGTVGPDESEGPQGKGLCGGGHIAGEVAEFLGIEPQAVLDALSNGQSLAQIAEANGRSRDELRAFLVSQLDERLDEKVAEERITEERAAELRQEAEAHIDELIDREGLPVRGRFHRERSPDAAGVEEAGAAITL